MITFDSDCDCLSVDDNDDIFVLVDVSTNFSISCKNTDSTPLPTFTWFTHDTDNPTNYLVPDDHVSTQMSSASETTLEFRDIQEEHAGDYSCKANTTKDHDFQTIRVDVIGECHNGMAEPQFQTKWFVRFNVILHERTNNLSPCFKQ